MLTDLLAIQKKEATTKLAKQQKSLKNNSNLQLYIIVKNIFIFSYTFAII